MDEFPWLAALVIKGTRMPFCGGSVINGKVNLPNKSLENFFSLYLVSKNTFLQTNSF